MPGESGAAAAGGISHTNISRTNVTQLMTGAGHVPGEIGTAAAGDELSDICMRYSGEELSDVSM